MRATLSRSVGQGALSPPGLWTSGIDAIDIRTKQEQAFGLSSLLPRAMIMPSVASSGAAPHSVPETDRLEQAADQAIAACGGDMRSAIRALILANDYLEYELCEMFAAVSKGYARGRLKASNAETVTGRRGAATSGGKLRDTDEAS